MSTKPHKKRQSVAARGPWLPLLLDFLRSRRCADLSPLELKVLVDALALLGPNARGNGDIALTWAYMASRGWTSKASAAAAKQGLVEKGLLFITRQGTKRAATLYAVALYALDCDVSKLDHGPGAYSTLDWEADGQAAPPTHDTPASWRQLRQATQRTPTMTDKPKSVAVAPDAEEARAVTEPRTWESIPGLLAHLAKVGAPVVPFIKSAAPRRPKPITLIH